jgi:hypothetical protein
MVYFDVAMTDIFEEWKSQKFIIADPGMFWGQYIVVLTDIDYWLDNYVDLVNWCKEHNGEVSGMTVEFPDDASLMFFVLRWS